MPAKKTTTTKKTIAKKKPIKKVAVKKSPIKKSTIKKVTTKKPSVIVKEHAISKNDSCCILQHRKVIGIIVALLLLLNTALLIFVATHTDSTYDNIEKIEIEKIGGNENYQLVQEIYGMNAYKTDQKRKLETVIQELKKIENNEGTLPMAPVN